MCPARMTQPSRRISWQPWVATRRLSPMRWTCSRASPGLHSLVSIHRSERTVAAEFRANGGAAVATLTRVVLQCYYRDDRVVRSLGLELRPPYPKGHVLEDGDWSLLDPVRKRPPMWRRA